MKFASRIKLISCLIFAILISSCTGLNSHLIGRIPASSTEEISYYLSIDKFKYYLNEYSVAMEGKLPAEILSNLRDISIQDIIKIGLAENDLEDSQYYDEIIYQYTKSKGQLGKLQKNDFKWNYNFFKNKLNEAFTLAPSKLDMALTLTGRDNINDGEFPVEKAIYSADEMTLDSGHYISNRTTRAIFWEAIENNRTVEFHLGDSREFLKTLKAQGGEILFEVKPLAKNYNKIFIVQYPGEQSYRYAITNIGGKDRLNHLTNQLNLSNLSGGKLKTKVVIKGEIEKFHNLRTAEHAMQLRLLPKADRVIIGQKESIDGKFYIFWKIKALKSLYDEDSHLFKDIDPKTLEKFLKLQDSSIENIFKDKKVIEDVYAQFENYFVENPDKAPAKFKVYNYDNFTIEMCDYVFNSSNGKEIRWRVVSNVWGDEIVPIARALKETGHNNITYMGTAGALANKNYKVGDLVIPNAVHDGKKVMPVKANWMKIEDAKYGGSVEHVGSPFEETKSWLEVAKNRSDFVEVETSYLKEIFNGPKDNLEIYLLISDILGSESETLAHATSGKRKSSQNKLLAELFKRDTAQIPVPLVAMTSSHEETFRKIIDQTLQKKSIAYRYLIYSKLKQEKDVTEEMILNAANDEMVFTDSFTIERLVKAGEILTDVKKKSNIDFEFAFPKSIIDGTWNPKTEKIQLSFIGKNLRESKTLYEMAILTMKENPEFSKFLDILDMQTNSNSTLTRSKLPSKIDPDVLFKIYTTAGFKNAGIFSTVTYNGNLTLIRLPTAHSEPLNDFLLMNTDNNVPSSIKEKNCIDVIKGFLKVVN